MSQRIRKAREARIEAEARVAAKLDALAARKDPPRPNVVIVDDDSWTPRLSRDADGTYRYCAKACGHGCTLEDFERARALAIVTAKRMGAGWTWRVWENLGWHCKVFDASGYIAIHPPRSVDERGHFHVMIDDEPFGGAGRWSAFDPDPRCALRALHKIINIEAGLVASIATAVGRATKGHRS